ncbi:MAG: hypothetical protein HY042_03005 [Spirochaetia bacterium]|nr:hypothetical protein [Spirochaetia bacterium]
MMTFVTLVGVAIAVTAFLYLLSAGSPKPAQKGGNVSSGPVILDPRKVYARKEGDIPMRVCPVCGAVLTQEEYLIAALGPEVPEGHKRQAQIYGCPHCYTRGIGGLTRLEP